MQAIQVIVDQHIFHCQWLAGQGRIGVQKAIMKIDITQSVEATIHSLGLPSAAIGKLEIVQKESSVHFATILRLWECLK